MIGRWKKVKVQQGKRVLDAHCAIIRNNSNRFYLHQGRVKPIVPSMWMLYDSKTGTTYYLYGDNLRQAKQNAFKRYNEALSKP